MAEAVGYDDGSVLLDEDGVTLRRYYFPVGASKRIPYRRIRRVWGQPMGWSTGKGRGWGSAHPGYWLPLDLRRPRKRTLVVLDVGGVVKPAFSPDDPQRVLELLRERIARPAADAGGTGSGAGITGR
jgi:hypothetical protein